MSKIKVSTLTGPLLDLWVAKAEKKEAYIHGGYCFLKAEYRDFLRHRDGCFSPSTDWAQGGPIIEREKISPIPRIDGTWYAEVPMEIMQD